MATRIVMPKLGDFMTEGTVVRLAKVQGDNVNQGEVIAEIETEKLNYDLEATEGGIFHPVVDEGANVAVNDLIAYMLAEGEAAPEAPQAQVPPATAAASPAAAAPPRRAAPAASGDVVPSTPGARRLAADLEVDLSQVAPSGPRGRIVEADVRAFAEAQQAESAPKLPPGLPTPSESKPLRGMRQTIARHMKDSLTNSAQLSYSLELDVTEAQRMRREASQGQNTITLADVLMKACAETLKRVGAVNSVLVDGTAHYFDQANIGLAVALGDGLIVPVIQDVGNLNLQQISEAATDVSTKARDGKLSVNDVVGATFTISVLGTVDVFTPILNPPENGILGVGRSVEKPVVRGGEVVIREMMTVTLTADHQVIDGAVAASFLRRLQATVERPAALFR